MSGKPGDAALLVGMILVAPVVILLNITTRTWRRLTWHH